MSVVFISHNGLKTALLYQPSIFLKGASVMILLMLGLLIFFLIPWLASSGTNIAGKGEINGPRRAIFLRS